MIWLAAFLTIGMLAYAGAYRTIWSGWPRLDGLPLDRWFWSGEPMRGGLTT